MNYRKLSCLLATVAAALTLQARAAQNSTPVGYTVITVPGGTDALVSKPFDNNITPVTLDGMFPSNRVGVSFFASPSVANQRTQVLERRYTTLGINKASANTYFFQNGKWRRVGSPVTVNFGPSNLCASVNHVILRNGNTNAPLTYIAAGAVNLEALTNNVTADATLQNDVYFTMHRPVPVTLDDLNLGGTPAFKTTTSIAAVQDTILVYDNALTGLNKASANTFYYLNSGANVGWRRVGAPVTVNFGPSNVLFSATQPAAGFVLRKATNTTSSASWTAIAPFSN